VAQGIDDGWRQARRIARQPSRDQWQDAIYQAIMRRLEELLRRNPGELS
jgi:hypothetical protein